jgi:hypothetical protein
VLAPLGSAVARRYPASTDPVRGANGSSDFDKYFTQRGKSLCAKFRADTLALVKPKDKNNRCEQVVNRMVSAFVPHLTNPAAYGAQRHGRRANLATFRTAVLSNHFQRLTEVFYAPTCLPKLVSLDHAFPTAPL